jgi:hypothetical protein
MKDLQRVQAWSFCRFGVFGCTRSRDTSAAPPPPMSSTGTLAEHGNDAAKSRLLLGVLYAVNEAGWKHSPTMGSIEPWPAPKDSRTSDISQDALSGRTASWPVVEERIGASRTKRVRLSRPATSPIRLNVGLPQRRDLLALGFRDGDSRLRAPAAVDKTAVLNLSSERWPE